MLNYFAANAERFTLVPKLEAAAKDLRNAKRRMERSMKSGVVWQTAPATPKPLRFITKNERRKHTATKAAPSGGKGGAKTRVKVKNPA